MKTDTKKLVLLDSHAIIHRAYHALPEFATATGEPTGALYGLSTMLIKILGELKPDYIVACFDLPEPTHRHEAYEKYKAGRAKIDENLSIQIDKSKEVFEAFGIPIYSHPGFEADDILGTICANLKKDKNIEIIIASGDMDTLQLVEGKRVKVYTLRKGLSDTITYDEKKVEERFGFGPKLLPDFKGLRGDPSDNIIGVPGIGEKTATLLIQQFGTVENIYKNLKKAEVTDRIKKILEENEEEAYFSKTLATIRKDAPINFSLPRPWRETLVLENTLELFKKLEFRTIGERVKKLLSSSGGSGSAGLTLSSEAPTPDRIRPTLAPSEVSELTIALWLIDSSISYPTMEDVFRFAKTEDSAEARKVIETELDKRKLTSVFEDIEKPIIPVVDAMNARGIRVDKKFLQGLAGTYHKELDKIEKKIWKEVGEEFNISSPKVLSEILFTKLGLGGKGMKKTPGGALSTKESELDKIKDKHPIVPLILEYRELSKLLSTYIDAIPPLLDKDSRLHSTFMQAGTTTGRIASLNPNLQNIPIRTPLGRVIRDAFVAEKGFKLIGFDYSQIELRIAAALSGDEKLIEIFKNGEDVHRGVAARVFKIAPEDVGIAERTKAKTINFGILYGMGVNALKANLGTDRKEAQEFYNEYFETFTGLAKYLDSVKASAARLGYTETMFGRKRYFSGFRSPLPYVRAQAERMAINAPIQGSNADIIKIAMKRIDDYLKAEGYADSVFLLLQVHDELVFEVREDLVGKVEGPIKNIMESAAPKDKMQGVPIVVESHSGDNWGELK